MLRKKANIDYDYLGDTVHDLADQVRNLDYTKGSDAAKDFAEKIVNDTHDAKTPAVPNLPEESNFEILNKLKNLAHSAYEGAGNLAHSAYEGAGNLAHSAYEGAGNLAHSAYEGAGNLAHSAYEGVSRLGHGIASAATGVGAHAGYIGLGGLGAYMAHKSALRKALAKQKANLLDDLLFLKMVKGRF